MQLTSCDWLEVVVRVGVGGDRLIWLNVYIIYVQDTVPWLLLPFTWDEMKSFCDCGDLLEKCVSEVHGPCQTAQYRP